MLVLETKVNIKEWLDITLTFDEIDENTGERIQKSVSISEGSFIKIKFTRQNVLARRELIRVNKAKVIDIIRRSHRYSLDTHKEIYRPDDIIIKIDASEDYESKVYDIPIVDVLDIDYAPEDVELIIPEDKEEDTEVVEPIIPDTGNDTEVIEPIVPGDTTTEDDGEDIPSDNNTEIENNNSESTGTEEESTVESV